MVFPLQPRNPYREPVPFYAAPTGYSRFVQVPGKGVLPYNPKTSRCYDPTTRQIFHFNDNTRDWEEQKLFSKPRLLDPIVPQSLVPAAAAPAEMACRPKEYSPQMPVEEKKRVYSGRSWEKVDEASPAPLKRVATLLHVLAAGALAVVTALGTYSTYALLLVQGNPVGAVVGFLTLYFGVATYRYTKIALEKLR